ncbi:MAG: methyltransferase domain-containing protein [Bacteroidales bacterium]|jgi:2-polyprenyl-3-methyl-5-hydroxy-6-metoxy-1,4-benzoquinol methylase|nr:methyltransferase domain-containing protein [Bacteroidales bacterium]
MNVITDTSTRQKTEGTAYIPEAWETVPCPFCGDSKPRRYERYGDKWQYTHVKCKTCGLIYQNPRPKYDPSFVHDAYEYYAEGILKNVDNPQNFLEQEALKAQNDDFLTEILQYDRRCSAILDVGCCMGIFLHQAMKYYPSALGVDVSSQMADFVEKNTGVKVLRDKYENIRFDRQFSCINMSHVIEHIPNPKEWLEQSGKILSEDGILVISVPNMLSLSRRFRLFLKYLRLRRGKWDSSRTPDHLFEPTVPSMLRFLNENGFEVVHFKTYSRKKMTDNSRFGTWFHQKRYWGSNLRFYLKKK